MPPSAAQVEQDPSSGAVQRQQRGATPPYPPRQGTRREGGKRVGQPRRPMQNLCDDHKAPACKSCKEHRGVRQCCSRHHEGHPKVMGGGQRCLPVQGGGGAAVAAGRFALWTVGTRAASPIRGRRGGSGRVGVVGAAQRRPAGPLRRAPSPTATVLPLRRDTSGRRGRDRAGHRQALTRSPPSPPIAERQGH